MNIGACPHDDCGHSVMRPLPEGVPLPVFSRETCPECHKPVWMLYSHIDPRCYTPEQFEREYTHDPVTKTVKRLSP